MNSIAQLSDIDNELNVASSTADMNIAINKKIEVLRTVIIEVIKNYYTNIYIPEETEKTINDKIEESKDFAYLVYYDGMGFQGTIIGQLVGGKIVADLKNMLQFLLSAPTFDEDENAHKFKIEVNKFIEEN